MRRAALGAVELAGPVFWPDGIKRPLNQALVSFVPMLVSFLEWFFVSFLLVNMFSLVDSSHVIG